MTIEIKEIHIPAELQDILSIDIDKLTEVIENIADSARVDWINLADNRLNKTKREYINGISDTIDVKPGMATITLLGVLPNIVENGMESIDLRTILLNSSKAKVSKKGHRYMPIFFRMMVKDMPAGVAKKAKKLAPGQRLENVSEGSKYKGMQKAGRVYGTYRTISEGVTDGWIRPKTEGEDLASEVQQFIIDITPQAIEKFLEENKK